MLDLQQLKYFVAVAERESISLAAQVLHISPSPLSRQIMALEERLGLALFEHAGKRLRLTATGQRYLIDCRALLAHAGDLQQRAEREARGEAGELHVGYVESAVHCGVLQKMVRHVQRACAGVRLRLHAMSSCDQHAALQGGALDIGLGHRRAPLDQRLRGACWHREPFMLALATHHPLAALRALTPGRLDGQPFVFVSRVRSPGGHDRMLAACHAAGFHPRIDHEVAEPSSALAFAAAGLGLAIVQASLKTQRPRGVVMRPLPARFGLQLEIHAVIRDRADARCGRMLSDLSI